MSNSKKGKLKKKMEVITFLLTFFIIGGSLVIFCLCFKSCLQTIFLNVTLEWHAWQHYKS